MKLCKNCKIMLVTDKATFCSDKCRKAYSRKSDINSDKISTRTSKSDKPEQPNKQIDKFIPNWQTIGLESVAEAKEYIIWHLKKSGILDYSVIVIGNKMFGNYKERRKEIVGEVKAFRADLNA